MLDPAALVHGFDPSQVVLALNFGNLARAIGEAVANSIFYVLRLLLTAVVTALLWAIKPLVLNTPAVINDPIAPLRPATEGDSGSPEVVPALIDVLQESHATTLTLAYSAMTLGLVISFVLLGMGIVPNWKEAAKENLKRVLIFGLLAGFSSYWFEFLIDLNNLAVAMVFSEQRYDELLNQLLGTLFKGGPLADNFSITVGLAVTTVCLIIVVLELAARIGIIVFLTAIGPLIIMGYAFHFSRSFASKAMKLFVGAVFFQFFAAVAIRLMMEVTVAWRDSDLPSWILLSGICATIATLPKLLVDAGGALSALTHQVSTGVKVSMAGAAMVAGAGAAVGLGAGAGAAASRAAATQSPRAAAWAQRLQQGAQFSDRVRGGGVAQTGRYIRQATGFGGLTLYHGDDFTLAKPKPAGAPAPGGRAQAPTGRPDRGAPSEPTPAAAPTDGNDLGQVLRDHTIPRPAPTGLVGRAHALGQRLGGGDRSSRQLRKRDSIDARQEAAQDVSNALLAHAAPLAEKLALVDRLGQHPNPDAQDLAPPARAQLQPDAARHSSPAVRDAMDRMHSASTAAGLATAYNEGVMRTRGEFAARKRQDPVVQTQLQNARDAHERDHAGAALPAAEEDRILQAAVSQDPAYATTRATLERGYRSLAQARGVAGVEPDPNDPERLVAGVHATSEPSPDRPQLLRSIGVGAARLSLARQSLGTALEESATLRSRVRQEYAHQHVSRAAAIHQSNAASLTDTLHSFEQAEKDPELALAPEVRTQMRAVRRHLEAAHAGIQATQTIPGAPQDAVRGLDGYRSAVAARDVASLAQFHEALREDAVRRLADQASYKSNRTITPEVARIQAERDEAGIARLLEPIQDVTNAMDQAGGLRRAPDGAYQPAGDALVPRSSPETKTALHQLATRMGNDEATLAPPEAERRNQRRQAAEQALEDAKKNGEKRPPSPRGRFSDGVGGSPPRS